MFGDAAAAAADSLREEIGDTVLAVGWYDGRDENRTGSVYVSEEFEEKRSGKGPLETSLLASLGSGAYRDIHDEELTSTIRVYETVVDVDVRVGPQRGIVIAVRAEGQHRLDGIVRLTRDAVRATGD
ncbi:MAG: hypothetical protein ACI8UR_000661 [Natronomonas sp.]|uniref:hypothetical protein n=1 Tax=Natronomonas sp. TaxID=2184060 RepID=UPI003988BA8E